MNVAFATCRAFADGFPADRAAAVAAGAQFRVWDDPSVSAGARDTGRFAAARHDEAR